MRSGRSSMLRRIARPAAPILVIGIGRAGGNIIDDLKRLGVLSGFERAKGIHILDWNHGLLYRHLNTVLPPVNWFLSPHSTGGNAKLGLALARRNRSGLQVLRAQVGIVILIAGLGGFTGGGLAPYVAMLTRRVGTPTIAIVTMPFGFEGIRVQRADTAIRRLRRKTPFVFAFSNQQLAMEMGDDALLDTIYEVQSKRIAWLLCDLLRHCVVADCGNEQSHQNPLGCAVPCFAMVWCSHRYFSSSKHAPLHGARHTSMESP